MSSAASHILGIDGGGTRSRFLVAEADGRIRAVSTSGPLNPNNSEAAVLRATLLRGLAELVEAPRPDWVHAGIAGVKTDQDGATYAEILAEATQLPVDRVSVVNDIEPLLLGGLSGRPGIALILGTGSHAIGRDSGGHTETCGGWGCLMDDCGSGYAIGRAALRLAVRMWDGRRVSTPFAGRVQTFLGIDEPGDILHRVHETDSGFALINSLGRETITWAADGEPAALSLVDDALREVVELVSTLSHRLALDAPEVVAAGGVAENPFVRERLRGTLLQALPGICLHPPDLPPVAGAILGAATRAGITTDALFLSNLRASLAALNPPI